MDNYANDKNKSFAMSYAKDLIVGGKADIKELETLATRILNWLNDKK